MPSPFPGMDPWIENAEYFRDFHSTMITLIRSAINERAPKGYAARGTQLVWMDDEQVREPDVGVFGRRGDRNFNGPLTLAGALAVEEETAPVEVEQPYLEILSKDGMRLVTVIEILSRSNKRTGDNGREAYLKKQAECKEQGVHLVEIDLLRGGPHTTAVPLAKLRAKAGAFDYHVSITTCNPPIRYYAVPIRMGDPLPMIPIPLDPNIDPIRIELQPLFERTYDTGKYGEFMDFAKPCDPPLTPEQRTWAEGILTAKGLLK
jgi:hypothetical protein